jgi:hypothetical protein
MVTTEAAFGALSRASRLEAMQLSQIHARDERPALELESDQSDGRKAASSATQISARRWEPSCCSHLIERIQRAYGQENVAWGEATRRTELGARHWKWNRAPSLPLLTTRRC